MKVRFIKTVILAIVLSLLGAAAAQKAGSKTVKKPTAPVPVANTGGAYENVLWK